MKTITPAQFVEMGQFILEDFPIDDTLQSTMYKLFNHLPDNIQLHAVNFGLDSKFFKDEVIRYLCDVLFDMTVYEYYISDIAKSYFLSKRYVRIDFKTLKEVLKLEPSLNK